MNEQTLIGLERLIPWLPKPRQSVATRFAAGSAIMALAIALQALVSKYTSLPGLSLLIAGVFVCAVAYDHGTGIYASLLAVIFSYLAFSRGAVHVRTATGTFALGFVCFGVVAFGEGLRNTLERAVRAERTSQILLRELQHRTQNTLAIIVALLELQGRGSEIPEIKQALSQAADRVRVQAKVYEHLNMQASGRVDAHSYLLEICQLTQETFSGIRPIKIDCHAMHTLIDPQKALALGIIANELITNAVKHAFKDGTECTIGVSLDRHESGLLRLKVRDNGSGCPDSAKPGSGTKLINDLVRSHKGSYIRQNFSGGCEVTVTLAPRTRQSEGA